MDRLKLTAWIRGRPVDGELVPRKDGFTSRYIVLPGKTDVHIDSVKIEEFDGVDELGRRNQKQKMPCVVVRLSCPKGRPVLAQPYGEALAKVKRGFGHEHHFYADVGGGRGEYTGIFWYAEELRTNLLEKVTDLRLIAVEAFKTDAGTVKMDVDLGKPGLEGFGADRFLSRLGLP
jgi:hypothetical protein